MLGSSKWTRERVSQGRRTREERAFDFSCKLLASATPFARGRCDKGIAPSMLTNVRMLALARRGERRGEGGGIRPKKLWPNELNTPKLPVFVSVFRGP